jgi:hypothetical protein
MQLPTIATLPMLTTVSADNRVAELTDKIHALQRRSGCTDVQIGIVLLDLKAALPADQYRDWCRDNFPRVAQVRRLERLALRFHDVDPELLEKFSATALDAAAREDYPSDAMNLLMAIAAEGRSVTNATVQRLAPKPQPTNHRIVAVPRDESITSAWRSGEFDEVPILKSLCGSLETRAMLLTRLCVDMADVLESIGQHGLQEEHQATIDQIFDRIESAHVVVSAKPLLDCISRDDFLALRSALATQQA